MKKTILKIFLVFCISTILVGCKKKNTDDKVAQVEDSIEDEIESIITTTPEPTKPAMEDVETEEENVNVGETNTRKIERLQSLTNENKILNEFLDNMSYLQSEHLRSFYSNFETGDKKEDLMEVILDSGFRYIDGVILEYLYDETGRLLDMENREGLIIFSHSNDFLEKELETLKEDYSEDITIDAVNPNYDSYIVLIFNQDDLLVGKFKDLKSEDFTFMFNEEALSGSLSFGSYNLIASLESSVFELYEKIDGVRIIKDENQKNINNIKNELDMDLQELYDAIDKDYNTNQFITKVSEYEFGIEKMNSFNLNEINKRFIKDFTEGYYVFLTKDEKENSIDLRYSNSYISIVFDNKGHFYYKSIINGTEFLESGIDIKDANDYTLEEIKKNVRNLEDEVNKFNDEKTIFTDYLDENIGLLNINIDYTMDYDSILSEVKLSGLDFDDNYKNLTITTFRNKVEDTVSVNDEYGLPKYDTVVQVKGGAKDIYYFFKENKLIGIYRSLYFDIADVSIKDYRNLRAIKKGLDNLNKVLMEKESKLKVYKTLLEQKEELLKK